MQAHSIENRLQKLDRSLAGLAKKAKIPGFRDGKVPPQAVVAKLGIQKVKEATVEQIIDVGMTQSGVDRAAQDQVRMDAHAEAGTRAWGKGEHRLPLLAEVRGC